MAGRLTDKQKLFALEYIICKNGTEAARRAGYQGDDNVLGVTAYDNLRNPKIVSFNEERFAEHGMRANEVIERLSEQARADMGDFIEVKHNWVQIDLDRAKRLNRLHQIKKIKQGKYGIELELYDSQSALKTLAQAHGLLKPDVQINVNVELVVKAIDAMQKVGLDPSDVFEQLIQQAADVERAGVRSSGDSASPQ